MGLVLLTLVEMVPLILPGICIRSSVIPPFLLPSLPAFSRCNYTQLSLSSQLSVDTLLLKVHNIAGSSVNGKLPLNRHLQTSIAACRETVLCGNEIRRIQETGRKVGAGCVSCRALWPGEDPGILHLSRGSPGAFGFESM